MARQMMAAVATSGPQEEPGGERAGALVEDGI